MVVFTCNHCGDSLQKPKVEKHYSVVCRTVKFLTCVDCFKDFKGEEYLTHTKCVTEEERYAAKGSFVNGNVKKGEIKQESWVEMVKSILHEERDLKLSHRNLLNAICGYNNIPRKKHKFLNFIKNSSGGRVNMKDVEDIWNLIEKYKDNRWKNANQITGNKNVNETDTSDGIEIKDLKNKENTKKRKATKNESKDDECMSKKKKLDSSTLNLDETSGQNKFNFQEKILEVLNKKGSISLKKLEKKVINAYLKETGEAHCTSKVIKKFNKKLKKLSNIEVTEHNVTLVQKEINPN